MNPSIIHLSSVSKIPLESKLLEASLSLIHKELTSKEFPLHKFLDIVAIHKVFQKERREVFKREERTQTSIPKVSRPTPISLTLCSLSWGKIEEISFAASLQKAHPNRLQNERT